MPEILSNSPEETRDIGERLALSLSKGSVVALKGNLGSGKTCFTAGIALGLGICENVTSPTYTIISEYPGNPSLCHIDAYRLKDNRDFEDIGGLEILYSGAVCVIEWSERIYESLPADVITVSFEINGDSSRLIKIEGLKKTCL